MSIPLPLFVAIPLVMAFLMPIFGGFGRKGKTVATVLANVTTILLLLLAVLSVGRSDVYEIGKWPIPLGINLVLDGLSSLLLLAIGVVSAAAMFFSIKYMEQYTAKAKYFFWLRARRTGSILQVYGSGQYRLSVCSFCGRSCLRQYRLTKYGLHLESNQ
jgi:multicomponent Na+:H+ antiporter subunit D